MPNLRNLPARDAAWYDYGVEADALLRRVEAAPDGGLVTSTTINRIITLTQTQYDALNAKVPSVLYIITGN